MVTQIELWDRASKAYGRFIPQTTFRRWVTDICLLPLKPKYSEVETTTVIEWCKVASRHPKGSPIAKQQYRQLMEQSKCN